MNNILIKNGMVVSPDGVKKQDVLLRDGKVAALGDAAAFAGCDGAEVVDAAGCHVFPGLIEPHMHIKAPLGGITDIMDFDSAAKCAAFGGITTFMDFSSTLPGMALKDAVRDRLEEMKDNVLDYSVHCKVVNLVSKESMTALMDAEMALQQAAPADKAAAQAKVERAQAVVDGEVQSHLDEIPQMIANGIPTFKLFMTYRKANVMIDDVYMLQVLAAARDAGGRCGFHAECNAIAEYNEELFCRNNTLRWEDFPRCKPAVCEEEAVRRVLYYAEMLKAPIYFFHISTKGAVEAIREAKKRGVDVIAETCSHYLTLTQEKNVGEDGILYLMSPPLRSQEDQDALWEGLVDGTLSLVTSDNCSFPRWMKEESLDRDADGKVVQDFTKVISGVSGIEERFGLMLHEVGRHKGFTLEKVAEVLCENPAKVFGCYPRKGCLQVGSDADVTVVNLSDNSYKLTLDNLHYPVYGQDGVGKAGLEYAVYGDHVAGGRVVHTIRRGEFLVRDGKYQGEDGVPAASAGVRLIRKLH